MSGRADIIALAQTLGLATTDAALLDQYYSEALIEYAMHTEMLLEPTFFSVVQGVATYEVVDTRRIAAAMFGTRELTKTTLHHLQTFDCEYRTRQGAPRVWCEDHENQAVLRLYPVPNATTVPSNPFPDNMGTTYPLDQLVAFASNDDETAAPWLDFPLACGILARDLTHQSSYRDPAMAAAAAKLGEIARGAGGAP